MKINPNFVAFIICGALLVVSAFADSPSLFMFSLGFLAGLYVSARPYNTPTNESMSETPSQAIHDN